MRSTNSTPHCDVSTPTPALESIRRDIGRRMTVDSIERLEVVRALDRDITAAERLHDPEGHGIGDWSSRSSTEVDQAEEAVLQSIGTWFVRFWTDISDFRTRYWPPCGVIHDGRLYLAIPEMDAELLDVGGHRKDTSGKDDEDYVLMRLVVLDLARLVDLDGIAGINDHDHPIRGYVPPHRAFGGPNDD